MVSLPMAAKSPFLITTKDFFLSQDEISIWAKVDLKKKKKNKRKKGREKKKEERRKEKKKKVKWSHARLRIPQKWQDFCGM